MQMNEQVVTGPFIFSNLAGLKKNFKKVSRKFLNTSEYYFPNTDFNSKPWWQFFQITVPQWRRHLAAKGSWAGHTLTLDCENKQTNNPQTKPHHKKQLQDKVSELKVSILITAQVWILKWRAESFILSHILHIQFEKSCGNLTTGILKTGLHFQN